MCGGDVRLQNDCSRIEISKSHLEELFEVIDEGRGRINGKIYRCR